MADLRYNVGELFKTVFGINSPVYITEPVNKQESALVSYSGLELLPDYYSEGNLTSWMGTPIVFPAKFVGGSYMKYKDNGEIERIKLNDFNLPPATMFSFRRGKNIERTNISGGDGTVKEYYGFDDWIIDVRGLCLDEPRQSAEQQIMALLQWEELADAFGISGKLFEMHKVSRVCLDAWSDNVQQGKPGVIPFQFQLYSDKDIILLL